MGWSEEDLEQMLGKDRAREVLREADAYRAADPFADVEPDAPDEPLGKEKAARPDTPCRAVIGKAWL